MRAILCAVAVLATAFASAQVSMGRQFLVKNRCFLMLQPDIKAELKITKEEQKRVEEVFGDSITIDGDKVMVRLNGSQSLKEITDDAIKVLNKEQLKRLDEIWVQLCDGTALADEDFASKFKLESKQKTELDKIIEQAAEKLDELVTDHDPDNMKARSIQMEKITKAAGAKMLALLNADQLKAYNELKGKEFKRKKKAEKD